MNKGISVFVNDISSRSEVFLHQLFKELSNKYMVEFLSLSKSEVMANGSGLRIRYLPRPKSIEFVLSVIPLSIRYKTINIRFLFYLHLLEAGRYNRLYFPFLYMLIPFKNVLPIYCKRNTDRIIFSSIRGTELTINPFVKENYLNDCRLILKHVTKLHFLSEKLKAQYNSLHLPERESVTIYQGFDSSKFKIKESTYPRDKLHILSIGRFNYVKGFEYLILACKQLKNNKIDFDCSIVGYGPDKEKFAYMIHDLDLSEHIELTEGIDHSSLNELILKHNIYVHPHIVTGISNSMLEAIACGLPVIAFFSDIASYNISDLDKVIMECPRYDYIELAQMIANFNYRNYIYMKGQERILAKFSLVEQANKFHEFFS